MGFKALLEAALGGNLGSANRLLRAAELGDENAVLEVCDISCAQRPRFLTFGGQA